MALGESLCLLGSQFPLPFQVGRGRGPSRSPAALSISERSTCLVLGTGTCTSPGPAALCWEREPGKWLGHQASWRVQQDFQPWLLSEAVNLLVAMTTGEQQLSSRSLISRKGAGGLVESALRPPSLPPSVRWSSRWPLTSLCQPPLKSLPSFKFFFCVFF